MCPLVILTFFSILMDEGERTFLRLRRSASSITMTRHSSMLFYGSSVGSLVRPSRFRQMSIIAWGRIMGLMGLVFFLAVMEISDELPKRLMLSTRRKAFRYVRHFGLGIVRSTKEPPNFGGTDPSPRSQPLRVVLLFHNGSIFFSSTHSTFALF